MGKFNKGGLVGGFDTLREDTINRSGVWDLRQVGVNEVNEFWKTAYPNTRAVFGGGNFVTNQSGASFTHGNFIQFIEIPTDGDSSDFGDLTESREKLAGSIASSTRGIFHGGTHSSDVSNVIDFVTIASTGNATDFGDFIHSSGGRAQDTAGLSNQTRGVIGGGYLYTSTTDNFAVFADVMQFVTIASAGNATDFGDLTQGRREFAGNIQSTTRGIFHGGQVSGNISNVMDFITIASTGNATDFGEVTRTRGHGGCSNSTRGLMHGGRDGDGSKNRIDFITIASAGNSSDFGDLTERSASDFTPYNHCGGVSSSTKAVLASTNQTGNGLEKVTIASTGNASDFGSFSQRINGSSGYGCFSGSHGGIG